MTHATYFIILIGAAAGLFILGGLCHQTVRKWLAGLREDKGMSETTLMHYVIVSAQGSVAAGPLAARRQTMRDALDGVRNAEELHTDFYDRDRSGADRVS